MHARTYARTHACMHACMHAYSPIKWNALALAADMFCVSAFSPGVMLYVYDKATVTLWAGKRHSLLWTDTLITNIDSCMVGRKDTRTDGCGDEWICGCGWACLNG